MPSIISIVEGPGDIEAVPTLLIKILTDQQQWQWFVGKPYKANNLKALKKNITRLLQRALQEKNCGALLILLDLDDGCPKEEAHELAEIIEKFNLPKPVAIVFAHREYEAWFLASLPTIAGHYGLPSELEYEQEVESRRDVKGWFRAQMSRHKYNPVTHQKAFTSLIDIELAYENSRSFRRLYDAVSELIEAAEKGERGYVSPRSEDGKKA